MQSAGNEVPHGQGLGKGGAVVVGPPSVVEVEGGVAGLAEQEAGQAALSAGPDWADRPWSGTARSAA